MEKHRPQCPFVYSNGKRCCGEVVGLLGYGPRRDSLLNNVVSIRFSCSDKDDHEGISRGSRMEFYPQHVPEDLQEWTYDKLERDCNEEGQASMLRNFSIEVQHKVECAA